MIVYLSTKSEFQRDVADHTLDETIARKFRETLGRDVGASEKASWRNSLPYMERVLNHASIPDDTGVAIEFNVPNTSRRIDFILTGKNRDGKHSAVIVELKQWETATKTRKDAIVETFLGGPCGRRRIPLIKPGLTRCWSMTLTRRSERSQFTCARAPVRLLAQLSHGR